MYAKYARRRASRVSAYTIDTKLSSEKGDACDLTWPVEKCLRLVNAKVSSVVSINIQRRENARTESRLVYK